MVWKFVRKIAKEKVIAKRNEASSIAAAELDFPGSVDVTHFVFKPFNSRNYSTRVTALKETIPLNSAGQKMELPTSENPRSSVVVTLKSIMDLQEISNED